MSSTVFAGSPTNVLTWARLASSDDQQGRTRPAPNPQPIGSAGIERTLSGMNALTEGEVAELLHMKVTTLRAWRRRGKGPKFVKFGAAVRYLSSDVAAYVEACRTAGAMDHP